MKLSLFSGTPMQTYPPDSIDFDRTGEWLYIHGLDGGKQDYYALQFQVNDALVPGELDLHVPDLMGSYIAVAPDGTECLLASLYQSNHGVRDVLYRAGADIAPQLGNRSGVPYEQTAGFPLDAPQETCLNLKPFYSWDGKSVVVPLKKLGLALVDNRTGQGDFVAYPEPLEQFAGSTLGTLPDHDGHSYVWLSVWNTGVAADQCRVYLLDLKSRKWTLLFELPWLVYQAATTDPLLDPWLVSGSRPGAEGMTDKEGEPLIGGPRRPRLAYVTPGAGSVDILETGGDPVWEIALESFGSHAFYMDRQRRAMVRLALESGELDIDGRWFTEDDKVSLFISGAGDNCYAWQRDVLIRAEWNKHDQLQRGQ
jgi:hypothetical protein